MKTQRGMECWATNLTLAFSTTRTAELSAVRAGHTLTPPPSSSSFTERGQLENFQGYYRQSNPKPPALCRSAWTNCGKPRFSYSTTNKSPMTTRTWYCNYLALISSVQRVGYSCDCCWNLCWNSSIRCTQTAGFRQGYCRSIFWFPVFCPETGICRTGTRPVNRGT